MNAIGKRFVQLHPTDGKPGDEICFDTESALMDYIQKNRAPNVIMRVHLPQWVEIEERRRLVDVGAQLID